MVLKCFQANLMNPRIGLCLPYGLAQKGGLLAIALIKIGLEIATQRQDQARNSRARTQVSHSFGFGTHQWKELQGIQNMAPPDSLDRRRSDQVYFGLPDQKQVDIGFDF